MPMLGDHQLVLRRFYATTATTYPSADNLMPRGQGSHPADTSAWLQREHCPQPARPARRSGLLPRGRGRPQAGAARGPSPAGGREPRWRGALSVPSPAALGAKDAPRSAERAAVARTHPNTAGSAAGE